MNCSHLIKYFLISFCFGKKAHKFSDLDERMKRFLLVNSNQKLGPCLLGCSNRGECLLNSNGTYACNCSKQYAGYLCEQDLRPCMNTLCLNGGVCSNMLHENTSEYLDYNCTCTYPFYGRNCERMINLCEHRNCSMRGFCKVVNKTQTHCQCYNRYEGEHCQLDSPSLVKIQEVVRGCVIVSSILIVLFYASFVLADIHTFLIVKDVQLSSLCCKGQKRSSRYMPKKTSIVRNNKRVACK